MVVPIFKGGSKSMPKSYRLVNLTITIMKLKEMIDREEMVSHIERHELLSASQHGFWKGRSCVTNLIEFQNQLSGWMREAPSTSFGWILQKPLIRLIIGD